VTSRRPVPTCLALIEPAGRNARAADSCIGDQRPVTAVTADSCKPRNDLLGSAAVFLLDICPPADSERRSRFTLWTLWRPVNRIGSHGPALTHPGVSGNVDPPRPEKPFIFIVYQDAEFDLANALKSLFECWGYDAFHLPPRGSATHSSGKVNCA